MYTEGDNEIRENAETGQAAEVKRAAEDESEYCRIKLSNLPSFIKYQQAKKLVGRELAGIPYRKLKLAPTVAYFSVETPAEAIKVVEKMNNLLYKNKRLVAKRVASEREVRPLPPEVIESVKSKTANEITASLWNVPYEEQLERKAQEARDLFIMLYRTIDPEHPTNLIHLDMRNKLIPILRSPVLKHYRNKCEFTIGLDRESKPCIGFVSGIMSKKLCVVVPVNDSVLITENTRRICDAFTEIVERSELPVFDEFERTGFWKRLVVRDFTGECMLIVVVHPSNEIRKIQWAQYTIIKRFLSNDIEREYEFNVRSVFWQVQEHASDPGTYTHLGGVPYIYETLLGVRFRVSHETFFQTNTRCAEVLYTVIGDFLRLPSARRPLVRVKQSEVAYILQNPFIILDICCGAGTISQCQLRRVERAIAAGRYTGKCKCLGVEIVETAVNDARRNAEENRLSGPDINYLSGDADILFRDLDKYYDCLGIDLRTEIVGVLDPPRAGVPSRVISSCRGLQRLRRLVFVSCEPKLSMKNLADLCRPSSNRYGDDPFTVEKVCPVDMFPQTTHQEWVVLLTR